MSTERAVRTVVYLVVTDQCLLDRDYGPQTGVSEQQVISRWGSVDDAPGVESGEAVRTRAVRGLIELARRHRGRAIVVVSHDAVNRQVLAALDPDLGDPDQIPQDNGCFNELEFRDGHGTVQTVNEVPASPADAPGPGPEPGTATA